MLINFLQDFIFSLVLQNISNLYPWHYSPTFPQWGKKVLNHRNIKNQIFRIRRKAYYTFLFLLLYQDKRLNKYCISGITKKKRKRPVILSITSYAARLSNIYPTMASLMQQRTKPDRIILYLPVGLIKIPKDIKSLSKRGLEIKWTDDIQSYKKIIPTMQDNPESLIVTADDDIIYPSFWLRKLLNAYEKEPQYIHCYRAHYMKKKTDKEMKKYNEWFLESAGFQGPHINLFPTNGSGTIFSSDLLGADCLNRQVFMDICPTADDVWLRAMSLCKNVQVKKIQRYSLVLLNTENDRINPLGHINIFLQKNDVQIARVFKKYDLIKKIK